MRKLKKYMIGASSEVTAISLVDQPAVETTLVYFNSQKPICFQSDEKRMVYSCVLRPDFPIYRRYGEEEFYVEFSRDCIEKLALQYFKDHHQNDWTVDHLGEVDGLTVVESWIKTDMEKDKSVVLGLDPTLPSGTWFVGCKVENEDTWQRIKNGEFGGFSIEAFVNLEEIKLHKEDMNSNFEQIEVNESFWTKITTIIKEALKAPETPDVEADVTASNVVEDIKEEVQPEEPAIDNIPEPTEEVIEEAIEEPVVEEPVEEPIVEDVVEPEVIAEEVVEEVIEEAPNEAEAEKDLQTVINELNIKIDALNAEIAELKAENIKLSKQPSTKPISTRLGKQDGTAFDRMLAVMNGTAFNK